MLVFSDKNMYYDNVLNKIKENTFLDDNYIGINEKDGATVKIDEKDEVGKNFVGEKEKNILKILGIILGAFVAIGGVLYLYKKKNYN